VLAEHPGFPCFSLWPPESRVGRTRGREGTLPGQLAQTNTRDIPCHITTCSAAKARGSSSQSSHRLGTGWALVCWWRRVTAFASLVFSFPSLPLVYCLYLDLWLFLTFAFPILSQSHWGGVSKGLVGAYLLTKVSPPPLKTKTSDERPVASL